MARNLIGTGADQVSVNGMLGELAFQTKENVNFTGGTGKLSKLDIDSISAQLNVSAVDVFVYDTSKDSDGGAWRKRCQHTSWYNEELNTSTRGSRREFPSVAIIVVTSSSLIIYDGDDASLPMWMVFNYGQQTTSLSTMTMLYAIGTAVCAKNGIIYSTGNTSWHDGLTEIKLLADTAFWRNYGNVAYWKTSILNRNVAGGYGVFVTTETSKLIVDSLVNDVAATVLPTASIDAITGLPIPTVALGTQGGVSVIKSDGTVIKGTNSSGAAYNPTHMVYIDSTYRLWYGQDSIARDGYVVDLLSLTGNWTADNGSDMLSGANGFSFACSGENANVVYSPVYPTASAEVTQNAIASGTNLCLLGLTESKLQTGSNVPLNALVAYVSTKYNTGWMLGDIRGSWLSDNTQETVVSTELVSNGTFDSNTTGWSSDATISVVSGKLRLTALGSGTTWPRTYCAINCVVGKKYTVVWNYTAGTAVQWWARIGTSGGSNGDVYDSGGLTTASHSATFTATQSTMYIIMQLTSYGAGQYADFDNISARIADADRSYINKGLQVFGSITKTPVGTGSDLVAYSGFSSSNYLQQSYNSGLDFGTGDFSVSCWVKSDSSGTYNETKYIFERSSISDTNNMRIEAGLSNATTLKVWVNGGNGIAGNAFTVPADTWFKFDLVRRSGTVYVYVNSVLQATQSNPYNMVDTSARLVIGARAYFEPKLQAMVGSIALFRMSATGATVDQIIKMYNDEKVLFQDNAKATLYGTSDSVTAVAYDEDTRLLHAGTSSGRSVFQGLRRIDNTTTAVSTSISAANGLVAEQ